MNHLYLYPTYSKIKKVSRTKDRQRSVFWLNCEWRLNPTEYKQWCDFYHANQVVQFACQLNFLTPQWKDYLCSFNGRYRAYLLGKDKYTVQCLVVAEETS